MEGPALLAVPVEIRLLDAGSTGPRVFRLAHSIAEDELRVVSPIPWDPGRAVKVTLVLPDDPTPVSAVGALAPSPGAKKDEPPRCDRVTFQTLPDADRVRVVRYIRERNLLP